MPVVPLPNVSKEYVLKKTLDAKLATLAENPAADCFILADAKDPDMARGVASAGRNADGSLRSIMTQTRRVNRRPGLVHHADVGEHVRNPDHRRAHIRRLGGDAGGARQRYDRWLPIRGSCYMAHPSQPFATTTIDHIQAGKSPCTALERGRGANLALYSVTFNNDPDRDLLNDGTIQGLPALQAEAKGLRHFLEVFTPNVPASVHGLAPDEIPAFLERPHRARLPPACRARAVRVSSRFRISGRRRWMSCAPTIRRSSSACWAAAGRRTTPSTSSPTRRSTERASRCSGARSSLPNTS